MTAMNELSLSEMLAIFEDKLAYVASDLENEEKRYDTLTNEAFTKKQTWTSDWRFKRRQELMDNVPLEKRTEFDEAIFGKLFDEYKANHVKQMEIHKHRKVVNNFLSTANELQESVNFINDTKGAKI